MSKNTKVTDKLNETLGIAGELIHNSPIETDFEIIDSEDFSNKMSDVTLREPLYDDDILNDYKETRDTLRSLISRAEITLDALLYVAKESEQPRAYEVASTLINTISNLCDKLMDLQKKMKELNKSDAPKEGSGTTNNNVFITNEEFQNMIEKQVDKK